MLSVVPERKPAGAVKPGLKKEKSATAPEAGVTPDRGFMEGREAPAEIGADSGQWRREGGRREVGRRGEGRGNPNRGVRRRGGKLSGKLSETGRVLSLYFIFKRVILAPVLVRPDPVAGA